jgi:hypothetical protein
MIKCDHCGHFTCLELEFPNCLERRGMGNAEYAKTSYPGATAIYNRVDRVCTRCRKVIHPKDGRWVAQWPDVKDSVGWWISQLNSLAVDPKTVLDAFENPADEDEKSEVYNSMLGMAYIPEENRLQHHQVRACINQNQVLMPGSAERCAAGVDVGNLLHVVIASIPGNNMLRVQRLARVSGFDDVWDLFKRYNVKFAVFDLEPETRKVREFRAAADFPVYGCDYSEHQRGSAAWNDKEGIVVVNRTEICDASYNLVDVGWRLQLYREDQEIGMYIEEMCNIAKVKETDEETGDVSFRYRKTGPDHYRHATNYCMLAAERMLTSNIVGKHAMSGQVHVVAPEIQTVQDFPW